MIDSKDLADIAPYTDKEAIEALRHVASHPLVPSISKYIVPGRPESFLGEALSHIHSIDQFQSLVAIGKAPFVDQDAQIDIAAGDGSLDVGEQHWNLLSQAGIGE